MHTADSISFLTGGDGADGNEVDRDSEDMQLDQIGDIFRSVLHKMLTFPHPFQLLQPAKSVSQKWSSWMRATLIYPNTWILQ
jgi:hypothetical protein